MEKVILSSILLSQQEALLQGRESVFVERDIALEQYMQEKEILIIGGVRRSGKSSLLERFFLSKDLQKNLLYLNFEDPQLLNFKAEDFLTLYDIWIEKNGKPCPRVAFFDEIQNVEGWEPWMNFFAKQKKFKVFITGSNSKLLSSELSTHLTGRQRTLSVFPLSFKEILQHEDISLHESSREQSQLSLEQRASLRALLMRYLTYGGFPRAWLSQDTSLLAEYYENIVNKDIVRRRKIRNPLAIDRLGLILMSNVGKKFNKAKLARLIGLKDADTAEKFIGYFEESFLGFQVRKYDASVRVQLRNQPKFYAVDPALARRIGIVSDSQLTFYLENVVLVELFRRKSKVYYWHSDKGEVDFVVETNEGERHLIQVCWDLEEKETQARELSGLKLFKEKFKNIKVHKKYIITCEGYEKNVGDNVEVIPFYRWALE